MIYNIDHNDLHNDKLSKAIYNDLFITMQTFSFAHNVENIYIHTFLLSESVPNYLYF